MYKLRISLSHNDFLEISNQLLKENLNTVINNDLVNYYNTPGNIFKLVQYCKLNEYDIYNSDLSKLLQVLIRDTQYKKDDNIKNIMFDLIEFYFRKNIYKSSKKIYDKYTYFINRISDTRKFHLDEELLFIEFKEEILNV